jgi:NADH:ubiquinone oxidoreductase subunit 6 (subunit J)
MVIFFSLLALLSSFGAFASFSAHTNIYFMILCFLFSGIVYYLLLSTYLAIMLFIVYVGAVAMLFVFCVILLNLSTKYAKISSFSFYSFIPLFISSFLAIVILFFSFSVGFQSDFFIYDKLVFNFYEHGWVFYSKDQFLTHAIYSGFLPYLVFLGILLFFVTVAVTVLLSLVLFYLN